MVYLRRTCHEVTRVYQTIKYEPKKIFSIFVEQATYARRQGDGDPSLSLHANMAKMSVNSVAVYGKTIINKERHPEIKYASDPQFISSLIASDRFVSLEEYEEANLCEVIHQKRICP